MKEIFRNRLEKNPVICAVKDVNNIDEALSSDAEIIFCLCGNIFNLPDIVS